MTSRLIKGLQEIAHLYDHFILDIFGVIHDGIKPFPGTENCLAELKSAGKQICLLSNTPRRSQGTLEQIEDMGISAHYFDHIVTAGEYTYQTLSSLDQSFGKDCWFIGTQTMAEILQGHAITLHDTPENASFIINSVPGVHKVSKNSFVHQLEHAARKNLPMICANPDLVVNIGEAQYECAGTFALEYEKMGGKVIYHGKPHSPIYETCRQLLGNPDTSNIIAVGDSIHTDITGANHFGIDSAFNLEGIHQEEVRCDLKGHFDLKKIDRMIAQQTEKPTYILKEFQW